MNPADVREWLAFRLAQPRWIEVDRATSFADKCAFGRAHPSHVCMICGRTEIWVSVLDDGQPADRDGMEAARARCTVASFSPHVALIAPGFFDGFGVLRDVSVFPETVLTEASFRGCPYSPP